MADFSIAAAERGRSFGRLIKTKHPASQFRRVLEPKYLV
jgi:hypothetical protein